jgi:hypothetical protein
MIEVIKDTYGEKEIVFTTPFEHSAQLVMIDILSDEANYKVVNHAKLAENFSLVFNDGFVPLKSGALYIQRKEEK